MQEKNLNLIPSGDMPVIYASQYDKNRVIRFNLFEGEDEYTLSGTEIVKCNIRKNDEHIVVITPTIGANKYIDIYLPQQACACFGQNIGEITISSDENTLIGTINFILEVERNPIQGGVTSETDIDDLTGQIEDIVHEVMTDDYYTKAEVDTALSSKANTADVYTKSQVDTALGLKADKADTYTKSQVDTALGLKADSSSVYTKAEVDTALAAKANAADVYTKTEVDEIIEGLYPINSASGSIATFTASLELPLVAMSAEIVAQQASGTPTPSNPLPITGFDSVNVTRTGKNLFDGSKVSTTNPSNWGVSFENNNLTIVHKTAYVSGAPIFNLDLPSGNYVISYTAIQLYNVSLYINGVYNKLLNNGTTFTIENGNTYSATFTAEDNSTNVISNIQIELGNVATDYHAYNPQSKTKTIALPETIYGGSVDCIDGKLTITHLKIALSPSWTPQNIGTIGNFTRFQLYAVDSGLTIPSSSTERGLFTHGEYSFAYSTQSNHAYVNNVANPAIIVVLEGVTATEEGIKQYIQDQITSNTPLEVVYPLATPVEITGLTGVNFTTSEGEQNIFSDSGDISVSFKQGIQEYIDDKLGG